MKRGRKSLLSLYVAWLKNRSKGLKKHYNVSSIIPLIKAKNTYKSEFVTVSKLVGYKVAFQKVLNWTSKGR